MNKPAEKSISVAVRVCISVCLIYFIVSKMGWYEILKNMRLLDLRTFTLAVFVYVLSIFIATLRWSLFIPARIDIKRLFNISYIGAFFNICLPGSVGGDVVRAYYLSGILKSDPVRGLAVERTTPAEKSRVSTAGHKVIALGSVVIDRYIALIALLVIGIVTTFLGSKYFSNHPIRWLIPTLLGVILIVSTVLLKLRVGSAFRVVSEMYAYADEMALRKKEMAKAFLYAIAAQIISIWSVYILSRGLSMGISFISVLSFIPVVAIISLIPVTISGIGLREGAFVVLFGLIGVSPEKAMTLSVAWFLSIIIGSLPGFVGYLFYRKSPLETVGCPT